MCVASFVVARVLSDVSPHVLERVDEARFRRRLPQQFDESLGETGWIRESSRAGDASPYDSIGFRIPGHHRVLMTSP